MSADSPLVSEEILTPLVLQLIAETLVIPADRVTLHSRLIADLGAESIDFLDMVFRLEEVLRVPIQLQRWQRFVADRFDGRDLDTTITGAAILEFAELMRREATDLERDDGRQVKP